MQTNYKEKILDKFCSDVFPAFMEFEEQRKKTLIKMILVEAILVLIPTLFFINIHVLENFNGEQLPIVICAIIFIEIIVALVYPNWVCSDFQNKLKEMAMPTVINAINGIKHMRYYCRFTKDELEKTGLFSRFSQMSSDDSFFGKYKNVKYQISELLLEVNGRKNTFTSFKGVVFAFYMNKNFESKVIITTKNDFNSKNNKPISMFLFIFIPLINFIFSLSIKSSMYSKFIFSSVWIKVYE